MGEEVRDVRLGKGRIEEVRRIEESTIIAVRAFTYPLLGAEEKVVSEGVNGVNWVICVEQPLLHFVPSSELAISADVRVVVAFSAVSEVGCCCKNRNTLSRALGWVEF